MCTYMSSYINREFKVHLKSNTEIFLPEFKVYVVDKNGEKTRRSYQTKNTVRGFIEGIYNSINYH